MKSYKGINNEGVVNISLLPPELKNIKDEIVLASCNPLCVAYSDDDLLAVGCFDCSLRIYAPKKLGFKSPLWHLTASSCNHKALTSSITNIKFNPNTSLAGKDTVQDQMNRPGPQSTTRAMENPNSFKMSTDSSFLLVGCSNGNISQWNMHSGQLSQSFTEDGNQILAMDYQPIGAYFATGGIDYKIRIYSTECNSDTSDAGAEACGALTPAIVLEKSENIGYKAHKDRIQCLKWIDNNHIASGGWDGNVYVWDIRKEFPVKTMVGPVLYGDGIDVYNQLLLIADSNENTKEPLQLWHWVTGRKIGNIDGAEPEMSNSIRDTENANPLENKVEVLQTIKLTTSLLIAKFSPDGRYIVIGGQGEFRILEFSTYYKTSLKKQLANKHSEFKPISSIPLKIVMSFPGLLKSTGNSFNSFKLKNYNTSINLPDCIKEDQDGDQISLIPCVYHSSFSHDSHSLCVALSGSMLCIVGKDFL